MYSKIVNPKTGRKVSVASQLGKSIVRKYLNVLSGGKRGLYAPRHPSVTKRARRRQGSRRAADGFEGNWADFNEHFPNDTHWQNAVEIRFVHDTGPTGRGRWITKHEFADTIQALCRKIAQRGWKMWSAVEPDEASVAEDATPPTSVRV